MTDHDERNEESCSRQPALPLAWELRRTPDEGNKTGKRQSREDTEQESSAPGSDQVQGRQVEDDQPGHKKPRRHISLVNPAPGVESEAGSNSLRTASRHEEISEGEKEGDNQDAGTFKDRQKIPGEKMEEGAGNAAPPARRRRPLLKTSDWGKEEDEEIGENRVEYSIIQVPQLDASLGMALMQKRKERGLEISEVCRRTRIPSDFIEHLEADRYEKLPPPVYTRSYISQLCREYGIDPQLCLEAYDSAQASGSSNRKGADSLVLVLNNDTEDGSLSYAPRSSEQMLDQESGILSHLPRIAVMFATVLLLLVVLSAVLIQQYRNYRLRRGAVEDDPEAVTVVEPGIVNLEELIPPHELPLRELPIPRE